MINRLFSLAIGVLISFASMAETVDTLLTIGNEVVRSDEFIRVYSKNNQDPAFDKASLDEYMNLFVNFKLKVREAESMGYDTSAAYVKELNGYIKQLEKPYFTNDSVDSMLVVQSYDRFKWEIRASHILISCSSNLAPKDTVAPYQKALEIYNKVLAGADFAALAKKNSADDYSGSRGGDLGYFTSLKMVYPFENAAYSTPVGEIAPLTRSRFGYHIIKVTDKIPARGRVLCAHIMRSVPKGSSDEEELEQKNMIMQIADSLTAGADFATMARKYSDDRGSSKKGGELPLFSAGQMVAEFEDAAFALKTPGEISEPVRTSYGWHIIKLIKKQPLGSFDDLEGYIRKHISKDERARKGKEAVENQLKLDYDFQESAQNLEPIYSVVDSTINNGKWICPDSLKMSEVLFTLNDTLIYTQADFLNYLEESKGRYKKSTASEVVVGKIYEIYVSEMIFDFERTQLPLKYPEFKHLVQEYHDGILLFNITDDMVWSKAIEDTVGLEAFYELNKQNYMWDDRLSIAYYTFNDSIYQEKVVKLAAKTGKKGLSVEEACKAFQTKINTKDSAFVISGSREVYFKGENDEVDIIPWESGYKKIAKGESDIKITYVEKIVEPSVKKLNEARGTITADYQNELEKEWIETLKQKYPIDINLSVFDSLIK